MVNFGVIHMQKSRLHVVSTLFVSMTILLHPVSTFADLNQIKVIDEVADTSNSVSSDISIYIDGVKQEYEVTPIIENGTTLVPMRAIFETFGAEVKWVDHNQPIIATKKDLRIEIKLGSYFVKINDETIKLNVQPKLVNGVTMVPLRFISEAFGADVEWDASSKTININKHENEAPIENDYDISTGLTYDQAVDMALKQSYKLKRDHATIKRIEEVREVLAESFMLSRPLGFGVGEADLVARQSLLGLAQTDINLGMAKKQVSITEEAIAFQVKDAMDEVITHQIDLAFIEKELEFTERQLELARIKEENGLESKFNVNMSKRSLEEGKKAKRVIGKSTR